jgi:hypothetical protein
MFNLDLCQAILEKPQDERPEWAVDASAVGEVVGNFQKFFILMARHPDVGLVPTPEIDDVWHEFMLHPRQYVEACNKHAGCIIDHEGGFGRKPEERPVLETHFAETKRLWQATFGEPHPADVPAGCMPVPKPPDCRVPPKPTRHEATTCFKASTCFSPPPPPKRTAETCKGQGTKCFGTASRKSTHRVSGGRRSAETCKGQGTKCFGVASVDGSLSSPFSEMGVFSRFDWMM